MSATRHTPMIDDDGNDNGMSNHIHNSMAAMDMEACNHVDVIKWKHFPRYWPFVRGIRRSLVNSPHRGQWRGTLIFDLRLNKRLSIQSWGWWFGTPSCPLWRHCNGETCDLQKRHTSSQRRYNGTRGRTWHWLRCWKGPLRFRWSVE